MRGRGRAFAAGAAVVALTAGAWWLRPGGVPAPPPPAAPAGPSAFQGVTVSEEDPDGTRWTLKAERGTAWESEGTGGLQGVTAVFERRGRQLRARAGRGAVARGDVVTLSEGVEIEWDRYRVQLQGATYARGTGRVRSEGPVKLLGDGLEARGGGVEIDLESRRARVSSGVHAVFSPGGAP